MTRNNIIPLHRATELPAEWRRLGNSATIAIAVFCVVYFSGQFIRGWLS